MQTSSSVAGSERPAPIDSVARLVEISAGYWMPRALHVVAELGVADKLDREPRSAADLAKEHGVDANALDRVLRLLASHGVFERSSGKYAHSALSRALRSDHPQSMRAYVRFLATPLFWDSWGALEQVVRSGKPAVKDIFGYFKTHPREAELFNGAMKAKAQGAIPQVVENYDFSQFETIADVGGGIGHLLKAILKSTPKLRGVLFDQPHVVEHAEVEDGVRGRLTLQGGDFFKGPLPRCDAYIVMEVLHDWNDGQTQEILQQIRKAAPDTARLLVVETVLPDERAWATGKGKHFGNDLDINMMVLTGGRERTPEEFAQLFSETGWRLSRVVATSSPYSIVEAQAT